MNDSSFVIHSLVKKETIEKRLYQELLTAQAINESTLVVAPTGLGKTIVAVLLIAYSYNPKKSIILLSPTKPLIAQHKKSILKFLEIPEEKVILLTGEIPQEKRKEMYDAEGLVICATPQTIQHDLEKKLINPGHFNLIIFDEAHRAVGNYSYTFISQYFSEDTKRLGLTASPGSSKAKIQEVADNLGIKHIEIRTEEDLDVKDYVNDIEIETIYTELDKDSRFISDKLKEFIQSKILILRRFGFLIPDNYSKKQILDMQAKLFLLANKIKSKNNFIAISFVSVIIKALHARELIETQGFIAFRNYLDKVVEEAKVKKSSKASSTFINSKEFGEIILYLDRHKYKLEYSKEAELIKIVKKFVKENPKSRILIFNNFRDNATSIVDKLNTYKEIKSTRFVGQATKLSDKGLSQKEQLSILSEFKEGKYNVLVCTSVGEEGLDIPSVDLVIFFDAVASEIRNIQRRGRTGRFNAGRVVLLLNRDTIDEKYYFVSQNKEKRMKSILKNFHKSAIKKVRKKEQTQIGDF
ncbi:MAG: helicase-related protein [archaeon]|jgi:Fanconi anemia group M protein